MPFQIITGDLLTFDAQYKAHQCNAVSTTGAGLAVAVFKAYPEANIYRNRTAPSAIGTISVHGPVINMIAQYYPGKAYRANDGPLARLNAFRTCLLEIGKILNLQSVAFPFGIGCGLAGGKWSDYLPLLEDFSKKHPAVIVSIVRLP